MTTHRHPIDPERDLVLERYVDAPPELVWRAWTEPELLVQWFTPKPWGTASVEIDVHPGGIFRTVMLDPEGQEIDQGAGCILEVIKGRKLVWTSALEPGFRPNGADADPGIGFFSAVILMEPKGSGTAYTAIAIHGNPEAAGKHKEMGFHEGWGAALDQLVELVKTL